MNDASVGTEAVAGVYRVRTFKGHKLPLRLDKRVTVTDKKTKKQSTVWRTKKWFKTVTDLTRSINHEATMRARLTKRPVEYPIIVSE